MVEAYYKDYAKDYPLLLRAGWGFTVETATQGIRLVLSGVFDAYPKLKIILGHLGEGLPFMLWRINSALSREGNRPLKFRELFCEHFWITTSGFFSNPGAAVLRAGAGRRPHHLLGRLSLRPQQAGHRLDRAPSRSAPRTRPKSCTAMSSGC